MLRGDPSENMESFSAPDFEPFARRGAQRPCLFTSMEQVSAAGNEGSTAFPTEHGVGSAVQGCEGDARGSQVVSANGMGSPRNTDEQFTLDPDDPSHIGGGRDSKFSSPTAPSSRPLLPPSQRRLLPAYDSWGEGLDNVSVPRSTVQSPSSPRPQNKAALVPEDLPPLHRRK